MGRQAMQYRPSGRGADVDRMFPACPEKFPRIQILVNNAPESKTWKPLLELTDPTLGPHHQHQSQRLFPMHAAGGAPCGNPARAESSIRIGMQHRVAVSICGLHSSKGGIEMSQSGGSGAGEVRTSR